MFLDAVVIADVPQNFLDGGVQIERRGLRFDRGSGRTAALGCFGLNRPYLSDDIRGGVHRYVQADGLQIKNRWRAMVPAQETDPLFVR